MRRLSPLTLVALLLLQTLAVGMAAPASAVSARGGANDDFRVTGVFIGNASAGADTWVQSNGTTIDYIFQGDSIEVTMEIARGGSAFTGKTTDAMLQIVHPIGFVVQTFTWTSNDLIGGQSDSASFIWTATDAHSVLDTTTNDLSGGMILRAMVDKDSNGDDRNDNDVKELAVPVAVTSDLFDETAYTGEPTFIPGRYPASGGNAEGTGSWQTNSGGAVGSDHWANSADSNSNYPSNAHDRLVYGYFSTGQCGANGQLDAGLTQAYQIYVCRASFFSGNYISTQFHIQAWGSMMSGDSVSIELWRGSGNYANAQESLHWNLTKGNPSQAPGQWTNLSWDPQVDWAQIPTLSNPDLFLGGNSWSMGMLLHSDSGGASQGFHVDDFIQFGISKVQDYTLDVDCNNPTNGYTAPPNALLILRCDVTNNGYSTASVRLQSNVTNLTWMDPAMQMIRIDVPNSNDHDTNVLMPGIKAGETVEIWVNLSIPPGADVQQQTWSIWLTDASNQNAGEKARLTMPVAVTEQYGVALTSQVGILAQTLAPGESGLVPFRLLNSGNKDAAFNLATTFSEPGWSALVVDDEGAIVQNPIVLNRGQAENYNLNITADSMAMPALGTEVSPYVSFNLRATCPSCGALAGTDVLVRNVMVPVYRELSLEAEELNIQAPANGISKKVYITVFNTGNDDEQYDLSLNQQNWLLGANLAGAQTSVLDAWDGEGIIQVNLPMPVGLSPGLYGVTVTATSVDDPLVRKSISLSVEILDTAAVDVSDEDADQSYIPGDPAQTMAFEVRNDGNSPDRFTMSADVPEGMVIEFTNLFDGNTPEIETGASYNVTVRFSFEPGTSGQLTLVIIATSVNDDSISAQGSATYLVGSQNWLKILPATPLTIDEAEPIEEWSMTVKVRNQYTTAQSVTIDLDNGESSAYVQTRIGTNDRSFVLAVEEERDVTVFFEVSQTTLLNLGTDEFSTNLTLWARSETVSDAASTTLQVVLVKQSNANDGAAATDDGLPLGDIMIWVGFIAVMGIGVFVILNILRTEEEEDDYGGWGEEGYENSLEATYGAVASAPTVPVAGALPTSLPPSAPAAPAAPAPVAAAPPVPAEGLPEGWTMEQWEIYGQMWMEQNGRA
ncbi:MAG: hypothetical protein DWC04_02145 [Candidatus Poseidoniales archaeon]|nr:MAG: hypothetical protein DWC04_02145 [Candidatus Poseidoniales archaeon]